MNIDTKTVVSMTEANQNFSRVSRLVEQHGSAIIFKNNVPRYLVVDFAKLDRIISDSDEEVTKAFWDHLTSIGAHGGAGRAAES